MTKVNITVNIQSVVIRIIKDLNGILSNCVQKL